MTPAISVVIATHNRTHSVLRLLAQLALQDLVDAKFEVVVVDDGSSDPVGAHTGSLHLPYALHILRQPNSGAAAARHSGVAHSSGDVVIFLDDDMQVKSNFLSAHFRLHERQAHRVVFGRIRADANIASMPLFERYHATMLDRWAEGVKAGRVKISGLHLCTGNVSMRRADYFSVGGFDASLQRSEDAELGLRLEASGCSFALSEEASSEHSSTHQDAVAWRKKAFLYGVYDLKISRKHAQIEAASPWRFLYEVHALSRPFLLGSALFPEAFARVAALGHALSLAADQVGAKQLAISGNTFVHGVEYFRGIAAESGSRSTAAADLTRYLGRRLSQRQVRRALVEFRQAVLADYKIIGYYHAKYQGAAPTQSLSHEIVHKVGLQMMLAYRVMRLQRQIGLRTAAFVTARLIRHVYGADIHVDAELQPGVMVVHGMGLVIGHSAKVATGCILFHNVTLGEGSHPQTHLVGSPALGHNVHVGPGASVIGPVQVGEHSKIGAGVKVTASLAPYTLVEAAAAVHSRRAQ